MANNVGYFNNHILAMTALLHSISSNNEISKTDFRKYKTVDNEKILVAFRKANFFRKGEPENFPDRMRELINTIDLIFHKNYSKDEIKQLQDDQHRKMILNLRSAFDSSVGCFDSFIALNPDDKKIINEVVEKIKNSCLKLENFLDSGVLQTSEKTQEPSLEKAKRPLPQLTEEQKFAQLSANLAAITQKVKEGKSLTESMLEVSHGPLVLLYKNLEEKLLIKMTPETIKILDKLFLKEEVKKSAEEMFQNPSFESVSLFLKQFILNTKNAGGKFDESSSEIVKRLSLLQGICIDSPKDIFAELSNASMLIGLN